jgi:hypothetical protein
MTPSEGSWNYNFMGKEIQYGQRVPMGTCIIHFIENDDPILLLFVILQFTFIFNIMSERQYTLHIAQ